MPTLYRQLRRGHFYPFFIESKVIYGYKAIKLALVLGIKVEFSRVVVGVLYHPTQRSLAFLISCLLNLFSTRAVEFFYSFKRAIDYRHVPAVKGLI